jgi:hypothetical protein
MCSERRARASAPVTEEAQPGYLTGRGRLGPSFVLDSMQTDSQRNAGLGMNGGPPDVVALLMKPQRAVVSDVNLVFDVVLRNRLAAAVTRPIGALPRVGLAGAVSRRRQSASPDFCQDDCGDILRHGRAPRAPYTARKPEHQ